MNEKLILEAFAKGDREAYAVLYKTYWADVYNFSRLYLKTKEAAEEVIQDVFIKLWEAREFICPQENIKGFLFIITRNIIFDQYRKQVNMTNYKLSLIQALGEHSYSMDEDMEKNEIENLIKRMVQQMPERQQTIFRLKYREDLSYKEIALRLGVTERVVERDLYKTLKFLKENISLFVCFSHIIYKTSLS